jgi:type IV secretion system protein VirB10
MSSTAVIDEGLPLVGEDHGNRGLWLGLGGIVLAGAVLFAVLENNRQSNEAPAISSPRDYAATTPQPELSLPDNRQVLTYPMRPPRFVYRTDHPLRATPPLPKLPPVRLTSRPKPETNTRPPQRFDPPPPFAPLPVAIDAGRSAPVIVHDVASASTPIVAGSDPDMKAARTSPAIASASTDRSEIIAQGTLIYAVLETAIDSTQSGQVRALISNDAYNASGTKILIPKGSRVFGEYKGELSAGQNRAQIVWGRLIRPDGVTISLDSPASDQLGRAGVKGRVDTHFGERLIGALLQSTLDFGAAAASRAVTDTNGVVIALPSSAQGAGSQLIQPPPKPTLKVRHGTGIAVYVARDLDFSAVE